MHGSMAAQFDLRPYQAGELLEAVRRLATATMPNSITKVTRRNASRFTILENNLWRTTQRK
jgi:hypothetical protein